MVIYQGAVWPWVYAAACIHTGLLPAEPPAPGRLAAALPAVPPSDWREWGRDGAGLEVCTLRHHSPPGVTPQAFAGVAGLAGLSPRCLRVVPLPPHPVTGLMVLAQWLEQRLGRTLWRRWWAGRLLRSWPALAVAEAAARPAPGQDAPARQAAPPALVYFCYGGAHTSVTAANIHLGRLPAHRRPTMTEIIQQPRFDRTRPWEIGTPREMGRDEAGLRVVCLGLASGSRRLAAAAERVLSLSGVRPGTVRFTNALVAASWLLRLGGFMSRQLGWVSLGRPLSALGVQLGYARFVGLVQATRAVLGRSPLP